MNSLDALNPNYQRSVMEPRSGLEQAVNIAKDVGSSVVAAPVENYRKYGPVGGTAATAMDFAGPLASMFTYSPEAEAAFIPYSVVGKGGGISKRLARALRMQAAGADDKAIFQATKLANPTRNEYAPHGGFTDLWRNIPVEEIPPVGRLRLLELTEPPLFNTSGPRPSYLAKAINDKLKQRYMNTDVVIKEAKNDAERGMGSFSPSSRPGELAQITARSTPGVKQEVQDTLKHETQHAIDKFFSEGKAGKFKRIDERPDTSPDYMYGASPSDVGEIPYFWNDGERRARLAELFQKHGHVPWTAAFSQYGKAGQGAFNAAKDYFFPNKTTLTPRMMGQLKDLGW